MATIDWRRDESPPVVISGFIVNAALRLSILYFTVEAFLNAHDQRFEGKNLGMRNLVVLLGFSMLFPALQLIWKKWECYPVWFDDIYLSIFWIDMFGNSLNLFESYQDFDLLPHFYGPGALAIVLAGPFGVSVGLAWALTMGLHAALEAQEWLGDVMFHTHNVRGWWDTAHDLGAGVAGATLYLWAFKKWQSPAKHPPERADS